MDDFDLTFDLTYLQSTDKAHAKKIHLKAFQRDLKHFLKLNTTAEEDKMNSNIVTKLEKLYNILIEEV